MGKINLNNYEAWLLDYFESKLDAFDVAALRQFVMLHPELEIDLRDTELPSLIPETRRYQLKSQLKRNQVFLEDEMLIEYLEKNLSQQEVELFEEKLANDLLLRNELERYSKTILHRDINVIYEGKSSLYKTEKDFILNDVILNYTEGLLSKEEKNDFEQGLIYNREQEVELELLLKTKLSPENQVIYPNKAELKRENRLVYILTHRRSYAVAASLLLFFSLTLLLRFYNSGTINSPSNIAHNISKQGRLRTNKSNATSALELANKKKQEFETYTKLTERKAKYQAVKKEEFSFVNNVTALQDTAEPTKLDTPLLLAENTNLIIANETIHGSSVVAITEGFIIPDLSIPFEEETDDIDSDPIEKKKRKNGFWRTITRLAKRANNLGIKSLDVNEIEENHYLLSFNSFSVEKK